MWQQSIKVQNLEQLTIIQMQEAVILSKANLRSKSSICNLALGIASPTRYFSNAQCVNELIPSFTSYLIIPTTPTPLIYNQYQIIVGVLPQTKNILLDLALPFYNMGNQYQQGYYFGRYLIWNQRLIGVRLSCSTKSKLFDQYETYKKWPMKKVAKFKVPKCILDYYRKNKFDDKTCLKQIKIGDFHLSFKNVRIRLFFQSELRNSQNLLNQSLQLGCEIISVINDIPREKIVEGKLRGSNYSFGLPIQNQLKQFARKNKKIVMYTGCRIAPLTELYLTNPFIIHFDLPQIKMEPHFLNYGGILTAVCNIEMGKSQLFREKPNEIKQIYNIKINQSLRQIKSVNPGKIKISYPIDSSFYGPIPEQMQNILKKMHLWHIYNSINQRSPFVIPLPLSLFTLMIEIQFKEIAKYTNKPLETYLMYFKLSKDYIVTEDQQNHTAKVYESFADLILQEKREKYFVYTEAPSQILLMIKNFQQKNKIFICEKQLLMEQQLQKNREIENIQKKMINFCDRIMNFGIASLKKIYKDNRNSSDPLTKDQLIVTLNEYLKAKIRASLRCHPFYKFIINLNRHQLEQALGEIQIQVVQQEKHNNILQNSVNNSLSITFGEEKKNVDSKGKQFFVRLQSLKKVFGDNQKGSQYQCHRCQKYLPKQYIKSCQICHIKTCFLCHQMIRGKQSTVQSYKQCLVCKKLCFCGLCTKKKKNQQKQRQKINASSQQIRNLSLSLPQKTLKQLEELQFQKKLQANACQICEIQGRPIQFIQIVCTSCNAIKCFNCTKAKQKDRKFISNWLCNQCKPTQLAINSLPSRKTINQIEEQQQVDQNQPNLSPISQSNSDDRRKRTLNLNQSQNKGQQKQRSASHSSSPQRKKQSQAKNVSSKGDNKNKGRSPSHSKSPPIRRNVRRSPSNQQTPEIKGRKKMKLNDNVTERNDEKINQKQVQLNKKNRNVSPSHSQSPILGVKKNKQPQKQNIQKNDVGAIRKLRSNSNSPSPVISRQEKKQTARKSPSQSNSPPKMENKKKVHSPSASKSPPIPSKVKRNNSPSQSKSKQKEIKEYGRKKPKSPSNSNSPQNRHKKQSNSRSRSRSPKKSDQRSHGMTSAPLWKKQSSQRYNNDRQSQNNSYQQRETYNKGYQNNRQPYNNDRGGYQRNNQGNWRGGRGRGQERGRGGDRGRGRGRFNDGNGGQQQDKNFNRSFGNWQSSDNRGYSRNQQNNDKDRRNHSREDRQDENKIVAIDEVEVKDNIDY